MAERIPGARCVRVSGGAGHLIFLCDQDETFAHLEPFIVSSTNETMDDRVLATILFTEIVGSTERAEALGDSSWTELLGRHNALVRRQLAVHRGKEINTAGDGFLASFDGPARAIRCAQAISKSAGDLDIEIRAGLHTGECVIIDGRIGGIAVHIGSRIASKAGCTEPPGLSQ